MTPAKFNRLVTDYFIDRVTRTGIFPADMISDPDFLREFPTKTGSKGRYTYYRGAGTPSEPQLRKLCRMQLRALNRRMTVSGIVHSYGAWVRQPHGSYGWEHTEPVPARYILRLPADPRLEVLVDTLKLLPGFKGGKSVILTSTNLSSWWSPRGENNISEARAQEVTKMACDLEAMLYGDYRPILTSIPVRKKDPLPPT